MTSEESSKSLADLQEELEAKIPVLADKVSTRWSTFVEEKAKALATEQHDVTATWTDGQLANFKQAIGAFAKTSGVEGRQALVRELRRQAQQQLKENYPGSVAKSMKAQFLGSFASEMSLFAELVKDHGLTPRGLFQNAFEDGEIFPTSLLADAAGWGKSMDSLMRMSVAAAKDIDAERRSKAKDRWDSV